MKRSRLASLTGTALLLGSLLLSACAPSPAGAPAGNDDGAIEQLTTDVRAFGSVGSGKPVELSLSDRATRAAMFVDGKPVYAVASGGSARTSDDSNPPQSGIPRPAADWDVKAIAAFYPDVCQDKQVLARSLRDGHTMIAVSCGMSFAKEDIDGHVFERLDDISSAATLDTLLQEAAMAVDLSQTRSVRLPARGGISGTGLAASFNAGTVVGPDDKPCPAFFTRSFEVGGPMMAPTATGPSCDPLADRSATTFDLSRMTGEKLAQGLKQLSAAGGQPLSESMGVELTGDGKHGIVAKATWKAPAKKSAQVTIKEG